MFLAARVTAFAAALGSAGDLLPEAAAFSARRWAAA